MIKTGKEYLEVEEYIELPSNDVEKEKLKYLNQEEEFKQTDVLILDKKKLFLDFHPDVDPYIIEDFYKTLTKRNTVLVILLKGGVAALLLVQNTSTILISSIFEN